MTVAVKANLMIMPPSPWEFMPAEAFRSSLFAATGRSWVYRQAQS
jgi:hypothetical protein